MAHFHSPEYLKFLERISPSSLGTINESDAKLCDKFNVGEDSPVLDGLYNFCQLSAGGSIDGAIRMNQGLVDVAINWAGGLHHARKEEAAGFCYVNDIVLGILELLKCHARVLYVDIDIHHGDGVEHAFYQTNRVMTCSFHKYGNYFPGTGDVPECGAGRGKYYAVNFPLDDGLNDNAFEYIFKPTIEYIMQWYRPGAVVMCCGADSLNGDRLGCWNLSRNGHAMAIEYVRSFNLPTMVLGGGGYTIKNVSRCWTHETALLCGKTIGDVIPYNDYFQYFGPNFSLHVPSSKHMVNMNMRSDLDNTLIMENLRHIEHAPAVQIGQEMPPDAWILSSDEDDDPDHRRGKKWSRDLSKRSGAACAAGLTELNDD